MIAVVIATARCLAAIRPMRVRPIAAAHASLRVGLLLVASFVILGNSFIRRKLVVEGTSPSDVPRPQVAGQGQISVAIRPC